MLETAFLMRDGDDKPMSEKDNRMMWGLYAASVLLLLPANEIGRHFRTLRPGVNRAFDAAVTALQKSPGGLTRGKNMTLGGITYKLTDTNDRGCLNFTYQEPARSGTPMRQLYCPAAK